MYPSERRRLEVASYRVPDERSLRLGRRKYENINRKIRSDFNIPGLYVPKETRAIVIKVNVSTESGESTLADLEVLGILEEDGTWCAISLALDLQGYGPDFESACADLERAMEAQFEFAINEERGDLDQLIFATERPYFEMFDDFRRTATLVQLKQFGETLQRMSEMNISGSAGRPAIRLQSIEESNATTD